MKKYLCGIIGLLIIGCNVNTPQPPQLHNIAITTNTNITGDVKLKLEFESSIILERNYLGGAGNILEKLTPNVKNGAVVLSVTRAEVVTQLNFKYDQFSITGMTLTGYNIAIGKNNKEEIIILCVQPNYESCN
jgi:hypothetical protein